MIQEVGVNVTVKCILWVKARPDYEPLFSILDGMRQDADKRFWIGRLEASEDNCDIEEGMGQMSTNVKIVPQMAGFRSSRLYATPPVPSTLRKNAYPWRFHLIDLG
jgi:hypothetical protein